VQVSQAFGSEFLMDDLLTGGDSIKGATRRLTEIRDIPRNYCFNLRKTKASLLELKGFLDIISKRQKRN
jgi:hypothetical protein